MAFDIVYDECCHCETVYPTIEGQYSSNGKFYCGNCISALFAVVRPPVRKMEKPLRNGDPCDFDYTTVVEFCSAPT